MMSHNRPRGNGCHVKACDMMQRSGVGGSRSGNAKRACRSAPNSGNREEKGGLGRLPATYHELVQGTSVVNSEAVVPAALRRRRPIPPHRTSPVNQQTRALLFVIGASR